MANPAHDSGNTGGKKAALSAKNGNGRGKKAETPAQAAKAAAPGPENFSIQAPLLKADADETAFSSPQELEIINNAISARLGEKFADYDAYGFSLRESCVLNILFDLMQEYRDTKYLSLLPVLLLKNAFGLDAEFYCRTGTDQFSLRTPAILSDGWIPPRTAQLAEDHISCGKRLCIPVRGRFISNIQEESDRKVRGILVLYPDKPLDAHQLLYFAKFANRLGFSMHNQALAQRNLEHLDFVRNLVKDIGHNVLGPNMYFKLLISKLGAGLLDLGQELHNSRNDIYSILDNIKDLHLGLLDQLNEIQQNFSHSSLFLESLLRESHFTQGRYVLRTSRLYLFERVVKAQFASYLPLFQAKGIETQIIADPDACDEVEADFGLISQVAANMFSNALKYTVATPESSTPCMRCRVLKAASPTGEGDGIRVEVLTTGPRIKQEEAEHLFEKYFRASNAGEISGSGKGLHFVNDIVTLHKGVTGYEATPEGNLFYFTLPCAPEKQDW